MASSIAMGKGQAVHHFHGGKTMQSKKYGWALSPQKYCLVTIPQFAGIIHHEFFSISGLNTSLWDTTIVSQDARGCKRLSFNKYTDTGMFQIYFGHLTPCSRTKEFGSHPFVFPVTEPRIHLINLLRKYVTVEFGLTD